MLHCSAISSLWLLKIFYTMVSQKREELEKEKEDIQAKLAQRSPRLPRPISPELVARALPSGAALIDFLEYTHYSLSKDKKGALDHERRLLAFVVQRGRKVACVELGPLAPIQGAIDAWRKPLLTPSGAVDQRAAADLRNRVWLPLERALHGARTVLLAPDGAVNGLAFAALPGSKAHTYLIEDVALGYVTSGRQLLEAAADDGPQGQGLLAVGGLAYGAAAAAAKGYGYLPGTRLEAERRELEAAPVQGTARRDEDLRGSPIVRARRLTIEVAVEVADRRAGRPDA